jgi:hypothetical protein
MVIEFNVLASFVVAEIKRVLQICWFFFLFHSLGKKDFSEREATSQLLLINTWLSLYRALHLFAT